MTEQQAATLKEIHERVIRVDERLEGQCDRLEKLETTVFGADEASGLKLHVDRLKQWAERHTWFFRSMGIVVGGVAAKAVWDMLAGK